MPKVPRGPVAGHMRWNTGKAPVTSRISIAISYSKACFSFASSGFVQMIHLQKMITPMASLDSERAKSKTVRAPLPETVIPRPVAVGPL